jgi:hypothetical protein
MPCIIHHTNEPICYHCVYNLQITLHLAQKAPSYHQQLLESGFSAIDLLHFANSTIHYTLSLYHKYEIDLPPPEQTP